MEIQIDPQSEEYWKEIIYRHLRENHYSEQFEDLMDNDFVFEIDFDFLRQENNDLFNQLLERPLVTIEIFENQIANLLKEETIDFDEKSISRLRLSFKGNMNKNTVTPRGLKSNLINKLSMIQGKVNNCQTVRSRLKKSVHFCEKTGKFKIQNYYDMKNLRQYNQQERTNNIIPTIDEYENPLTFEYGESIYTDYQIINVQEDTENVPHGQLSRSIQVILQEDMVEQTKPGDKVQIIGVLRVETKNNFQNLKYFIAYNVVSLTQEKTRQQFSQQEITLFQSISQNKELIDIFVRSVAPAIQGHDIIKEGLLLMLLGGNEVFSKNEIRIRGDLNILLIGDPGMGKSQLLRKINQLAPLSINSTGRGSTGVGLTAAVITDDQGSKTLEAGAMVLADKGIICIDEFDKMRYEDRVALHEVMEQQTVSIAKGGIHTILNARCSVLASANPIYGEYNPKFSPGQNIAMPESLLSRFDLIYIVIDENNEKKDHIISEKVTNNHRFSDHNSRSVFNQITKGQIERELIEEKDNEITEAFEQFNPIFHLNKQTKYLANKFLKKYIAFAKQQVFPILTTEAANFISEKWTFLRQKETQIENLIKILPISIRSLESMIRISTAYAKLRLSKKVEIVDAVLALKLYTKVFYKGHKNIDTNFFECFDEYLDFGRAMETFKKIDLKKNNKQIKQLKNGNSKNRTKPAPDSNGEKIEKIDKSFKKQLRNLFKVLSEINQGKIRMLQSPINIESLWEYVNKEKQFQFKSKNEFTQALQYLEENSKIMLESNRIFIL